MSTQVVSHLEKQRPLFIFSVIVENSLDVVQQSCAANSINPNTLTTVAKHQVDKLGWTLQMVEVVRSFILSFLSCYSLT